MPIVFVLFFIIIFLELLILGLIFSSIIINVESLEIQSINKKIYVNEIIISVEIKLYRRLKILRIKFYKEYFKVWGIKIYYSKALDYKNKKVLTRKVINLFKKITNIKPDLEYFKFDLNFGTEDVIITSFFTVTLSGLITLLLTKCVRDFNNNDYNFKIVPNYINTNNFNMSLKSKINFKTLQLMESNLK